MIVYYCNKCKMVDIGNDNEETLCKRCGLPMLSLGISTAEWNMLDNEAMKSVIMNCVAEHEKKTIVKQPVWDDDDLPSKNISGASQKDTAFLDSGSTKSSNSEPIKSNNSELPKADQEFDDPYVFKGKNAEIKELLWPYALRWNLYKNGKEQYENFFDSICYMLGMEDTLFRDSDAKNLEVIVEIFPFVIDNVIVRHNNADQMGKAIKPLIEMGIYNVKDIPLEEIAAFCLYNNEDPSYRITDKSEFKKLRKRTKDIIQKYSRYPKPERNSGSSMSNNQVRAKKVSLIGNTRILDQMKATYGSDYERVLAGWKLTNEIIFAPGMNENIKRELGSLYFKMMGYAFGGDFIKKIMDLQEKYTYKELLALLEKDNVDVDSFDLNIGAITGKLFDITINTGDNSVYIQCRKCGACTHSSEIVCSNCGRLFFPPK